MSIYIFTLFSKHEQAMYIFDLIVSLYYGNILIYLFLSVNRNYGTINFCLIYLFSDILKQPNLCIFSFIKIFSSPSCIIVLFVLI